MGYLVPSDEEILWLKCGWWIESRTQIVIESSFGAIFYSLRMNRSIVDGLHLAGGRSAVRQNQQWTRTVRGLHADGPPVHRMADSCSLVMILLGLDVILEYMNLMIDY